MESRGRPFQTSVTSQPLSSPPLRRTLDSRQHANLVTIPTRPWLPPLSMASSQPFGASINYPFLAMLTSCSQMSMPTCLPQNVPPAPLTHSYNRFFQQVCSAAQDAHLPQPNSTPGQFQLALLGNCYALVSVFYGCSKTLKPFGQIPQPLQDIVLVTQFKRAFLHKGENCKEMGNAYFHLERKCVINKFPTFDPSNVTISNNLCQGLTQSHKLPVYYSLDIHIPWSVGLEM